MKQSVRVSLTLFVEGIRLMEGTLIRVSDILGHKMLWLCTRLVSILYFVFEFEFEFEFELGGRLE